MSDPRTKRAGRRFRPRPLGKPSGVAKATTVRLRAWRREKARRFLPLAREIADAFSRHGLLIYTSAIAFRALVSLVPLTLLSLGLLGAFGLQSVWTDTLAPTIGKRVTPEVFTAIDSSVEKILSSGTAGLIAFAAALALWHLSVSVAQVMQALNRIHEVDDERPFLRRALVAIGLAVVTAVGLIGTMLVVAVAPTLADHGVLHVVLGLGRWVFAVGALVAIVGLVVRYAPAEHPEPRWASAGSLAVVLTWIVATLAFRWWVGSVANFKSATGSLTAFLLLSAYLWVSVAIFIAGAQLDELLRTDHKRR
jgi:membrane protein